jgi:5-methylcytosine-specific restriction enzyme subunit McrC
LRAVLEPVCDPSGLDLRALRREITYNRLNAHYERAHALAWLVLDALGIDDLLALGSTRSFAFLLDMNLLFERFVERLVAGVIEPRRYRVDSQVVHSSIIWNAVTQKPYSRVIPDLVVRRRGTADRRLAIDAKYKLYDERRIDPSDIYQTFLYAYALGSRAVGVGPTALLLYPASSSERKSIRLKVRSLYSARGAEIVGLGIPIPAALTELESGQAGAVQTAVRAAIAEALEDV